MAAQSMVFQDGPRISHGLHAMLGREVTEGIEGHGFA
jgi:hypothetical protein